MGALHFTLKVVGKNAKVFLYFPRLLGFIWESFLVFRWSSLHLAKRKNDQGRRYLCIFQFLSAVPVPVPERRLRRFQLCCRQQLKERSFAEPSGRLICIVFFSLWSGVCVCVCVRDRSHIQRTLPY